MWGKIAKWYLQPAIYLSTRLILWRSGSLFLASHTTTLSWSQILPVPTGLAGRTHTKLITYDGPGTSTTHETAPNAKCWSIVALQAIFQIKK